jgi:hypothetical protein
MVGWRRFTAQLLSAGGAARAERDAVIHLHVIADDGGLAHHRAGAVINEEVGADLVAPGCRSMPVRAWAHSVMMRGMSAMPLQIELMGEPLHGDGLDERIGHDDLLFAQRRGVAVESCFRVGLEQFADAGQAAKKFQA